MAARTGTSKRKPARKAASRKPASRAATRTSATKRRTPGAQRAHANKLQRARRARLKREAG